MNDRFQPLLRANHVEHHRRMIGISVCNVAPTLLVNPSMPIICLWCSTWYHEEHNVCVPVHLRSLWDSTVASDPGCDLTAEDVQQYLAWSGQTHRTSLVDRHQSNGVEVINRQVMVLLRALVCDRQIQNNWSEIQNIGTVQFIINEHVSIETSTSTFSLTFGELDEIYMRLPEDKDLNSAGDDYVSHSERPQQRVSPVRNINERDF